MGSCFERSKFLDAIDNYYCSYSLWMEGKMMEKYRVIGGYHDGEWHPCEYEATKIAEYQEIKPNIGGTMSHDIRTLIHIYHKHEYRFCNTGYGDATICVLAPPRDDMDDTLRNLINGYVPKKKRKS